MAKLLESHQIQYFALDGFTAHNSCILSSSVKCKLREPTHIHMIMKTPFGRNDSNTFIRPPSPIIITKNKTTTIPNNKDSDHHKSSYMRRNQKDMTTMKHEYQKERDNPHHVGLSSQLEDPLHDAPIGRDAATIPRSYSNASTESNNNNMNYNNRKRRTPPPPSQDHTQYSQQHQHASNPAPYIESYYKHNMKKLRKSYRIEPIQYTSQRSSSFYKPATNASVVEYDDLLQEWLSGVYFV